MRLKRTSGPLSRLNASPLSLKLALLGAGLTAVVVGVAFMVLRSRAEAAVRRVFIAELEASQRQLRAMQDQNLQLLLQTSALVSTSPTLVAALSTWREGTKAGPTGRLELLETIKREVQNTFEELGRDLLVVTDDSGRVLASLPRGAYPSNARLRHIPAIRATLDREGGGSGAAAFGLLRHRGTTLQIGTVPIVVAGFPVGVLMVGSRLERALPPSDARTGSYAAVAAGRRILTSTVPGLAPGALLDTAAVARGRLEGGGQEYVVASQSLGLTDAGQPATLVLARSLTASLEPVTATLGRNFLLAGLVAVILVGLGGAALAHGTLRPLSRFVAFMREKMDVGGFAQYEPQPDEPAEIVTLTEAYNGLIDSLSRQHQQLEERSMQLATANESLHEEVQERERAEQALKESEEQLRQSQKLEALGTLAGGVAHDFNNLLSVIIGYAQIAGQQLAPEAPLAADLAQINRAADRATGLVRQLLAFSRKQVLQPQVIDLNQIVFGMEKMLRRLIGEDVNLATHLASRLDRITADPGQIEQVLLNLAVNARDAMPRGGALTISTEGVTLGKGFENRPDAIAAGPAVVLTVSDTGVGMDAATRLRIFEPFFTTKAPGKGTGLGLATVYGIVRQSGGSIKVYSEVGKGTTFRIFFKVAKAEDVAAADPVETHVPPGSETLLVAEDEGQLRTLIQRSLSGLGYTVLEAADGQEALQVAASHQGPIHLLVTDVVMPHLSGKELAEQLAATRRNLKVVFVSGYADDAIAHHGVLAPGTTFLQKPVSMAALARTVRDVLDGRPAARTQL